MRVSLSLWDHNLTLMSIYDSYRLIHVGIGRDSESLLVSRGSIQLPKSSRLSIWTDVVQKVEALLTSG